MSEDSEMRRYRARRLVQRAQIYANEVHVSDQVCPHGRLGGCVLCNLRSAPAADSRDTRVTVPLSAELDIPGATPLTADDWAEMITDIANAWERHCLTADDKAGGYKLQMSSDLRAFAKWFPTAGGTKR